MANYIRSQSEAFDFTNAPTLTGAKQIQAAIGDYILVAYAYENRAGANQNQTSSPTWNGQTLDQISFQIPDGIGGFDTVTDFVYYDPDDLMTRISVYGGIAASAGTFDVIGAMDYYVGAHAVASVYGGVDADDTIGPAAFTSKFGSWAGPALIVSGVASGDVLVDMLSTSLYNSSYDTVTITAAAAEGQTVISDTTSTAAKAGKLKVGYKTGEAGDIDVAYTITGGQPIYGYLAFTIKSSSTISNLDTPLRPGETYTLDVTDLDAWESVTFGGVECDFVDGVSVSLPAWTHGYVENLNVGNSYTLTITDINDAVATIVRPYAAPAGYTHNVMGDGMAIDTGDQSIGKDPAVIDGVDVFPPALGGGTMNNAGQFTGVPFDTYEGFWLRDLDKEMWQFGITLTNSSVIMDHTPDPFSFTAVNDADPDTEYTSNEVTITGLGLESDLSIVGGQYSKNGGAFTSSDGVINTGDTLELKITSSINPMDTVNSTVTVGTFSATFRVSGPAAGGGSGGGDEFGTIYLTARGM